MDDFRASFLFWIADAVQVCFAFAFGACLGSLTNVLVYRLPLGLDVVSPSSRCPNCGVKLTWRENIPVFGWLFLRGRCRFCWQKISSEYPIVEAAVGVLFAVSYWLWYVVSPGSTLLGLPIGHIRPEYALSGMQQTWPAWVLLLMALTCAIAMALTDLKTFTVPLVLAWISAGAGILVHPLHALVVELTRGRLISSTPGYVWTIPTPDPTNWWWIGAAIGGMVGVGVGNLLLSSGLIRRSFADYDQWETEARAAEEAAGQSADPDAPPSDMWIRYPHARREMVKELAFLAPALGLGMLGGWLAKMIMVPAGAGMDLYGIGPQVAAAPLWLTALTGALMGYLLGGGVVWLVRILGSVGFGKEAIGMGDVHLMAGIGACLGWIDAVLAFFTAAFVGLAWEVVSRVALGQRRRAMPFVPCLVVATLLVVFGKPVFEAGLGALVRGVVHLP